MSVISRWMMLGLLVAGSGCQLIYPGKMEAVRPVSEHPRAGNVYLVRGFIGIFSFGMDKLGEKIEERGIRANVYQDVQTSQLARTIADKYRGVSDPEPLVLIGHSYGADDVVTIARQLDKAGVPVDLLVTVDPVIAGDVPKNVKLTYNVFRSNGFFDYLPWLRGIPLKQAVPGAGTLMNVDIRRDRPELMDSGTNHFTIDKNEKVQDAVVEQVLTICPPREAWTAARQEAPPGDAQARATGSPRLATPGTQPAVLGQRSSAANGPNAIADR